MWDTQPYKTGPPAWHAMSDTARPDVSRTWHGMAWGGHRVGKRCPNPRRAYRACNSAGTPASRQAGPLTAKQLLLGQSKLWPSPPRPPSTDSAAPVSRFGHPLSDPLRTKPFAAPIGPLRWPHRQRGIDHTWPNTTPATQPAQVMPTASRPLLLRPRDQNPPARSCPCQQTLHQGVPRQRFRHRRSY